MNKHIETETQPVFECCPRRVRANERTQIMASIRWTSPAITWFEINALFCHQMCWCVNHLFRCNHFTVKLIFYAHSRDKCNSFYLFNYLSRSKKCLLEFTSDNYTNRNKIFDCVHSHNLILWDFCILVVCVLVRILLPLIWIICPDLLLLCHHKKHP